MEALKTVCSKSSSGMENQFRFTDGIVEGVARA